MYAQLAHTCIPVGELESLEDTRSLQAGLSWELDNMFGFQSLGILAYMIEGSLGRVYRGRLVDQDILSEGSSGAMTGSYAVVWSVLLKCWKTDTLVPLNDLFAVVVLVW